MLLLIVMSPNLYFKNTILNLEPASVTESPLNKRISKILY